MVFIQMFNNISQGPGTESIATYTMEIVIMLLVSFILGAILVYFIKSKKSDEQQVSEVKNEDIYIQPIQNFKNSGESSEFAMLKSELAEAKAAIASLSAKPDNSNTIENQWKEINLKTTEIVSLKTEVARLNSELEICKTQNASYKVQVAAIYSTKDDLKIIEGIGPKIEAILNGAQIYTYQQLAELSSERIKEILLTAGDRYRIHDPNSWPMQASLAAKGMWEELKKIQEELNGGKKA